MKSLAIRLVGAALFAVLSATASAQDTAEQAAERFGSRSSVLDISLSPSGTKIAWIAPGPGHTDKLQVFDLNGSDPMKTILFNTEINVDISQCEWATDDDIICGVYGVTRRQTDSLLLGFRRLVALDAAGKEVRVVSQQQSDLAMGFSQDGGTILALDVVGETGKVLVTRDYLPESNTMTRRATSREGLGVDRLDIATLDRAVDVRPDERATRYLADETGEVRFKERIPADVRGYDSTRSIYMYRKAGENSWEMLEGVTLNGAPIEDFTPVSVSAARNSIYAYHPINGFRALIEIPLDGSGAARLIASRDDVDVDGLVRIGRQRRVVGVSYSTEKRSVEYFDQELAKLARDLGQALPNQPLISFAGSSSDESKLLIIASSDTDPGTVYLYDKGTSQLELLLAMRDALVDVAMGQMQPITYPAADGTQIPGYLTLPAGSDGKMLPAVVLPHGGPAARDYWGFDWLVQFFTARGYAVLQPNYRGSSGYGEAWFGRNGYQQWDVAIGDVNDAGRWLVSEGIANPDQLAIVGCSYGGHAALQSQVMDPDLFKAVVAIAPVTDLEFLRTNARNYTSFNYRNEQLGEGPHIAAGSPRRHVDGFRAPVALFHGTFDLNVNVRHSQAMADALKDEGKPVTYVEFEELQHNLGDSKARREMLAEIDRFLATSLGR